MSRGVTRKNSPPSPLGKENMDVEGGSRERSASVPPLQVPLFRRGDSYLELSPDFKDMLNNIKQDLDHVIEETASPRDPDHNVMRKLEGLRSLLGKTCLVFSSLTTATDAVVSNQSENTARIEKIDGQLRSQWQNVVTMSRNDSRRDTELKEIKLELEQLKLGVAKLESNQVVILQTLQSLTKWLAERHQERKV